MRKIASYLLVGLFLLVLAVPVSAQVDAPYELALVQTLQLENPLMRPQWSYDGKYLAAVEELYPVGKVHIWESTTWELVASFDCNNVWWGGLSWSPTDYTLAAGCPDGEAGGETIFTRETLSLPQDSVELIRFNSDVSTWSSDGSQLAVALNDYTIGIFDAASLELQYALGEPCVPDPSTTEGGGCPVRTIQLSWSPDGKYILESGVGMIGVIDIWDTETKQELPYIDDTVYALWSPEGDYFMTNYYNLGLNTWAFSQGLFKNVGGYPVELFGDWFELGFAWIAHSNFIVFCSAEGVLQTLDTLDFTISTLPDIAQGTPATCASDSLTWASNGLLAVAEQDGMIHIWDEQ